MIIAITEGLEIIAVALTLGSVIPVVLQAARKLAGRDIDDATVTIAVRDKEGSLRRLELEDSDLDPDSLRVLREMLDARSPDEWRDEIRRGEL